MSYRLSGPRCIRCVQLDVRPPRAVFDDGLCSQHWRQATPGEREDADHAGAPLSRFDALVALREAYEATSPEFSAELRAWLNPVYDWERDP